MNIIYPLPSPIFRYLPTLLISTLLILSSCKEKEELIEPSAYVSLWAINDITESSATINTGVQHNKDLSNYGIVFSTSNTTPRVGGENCTTESSINLNSNSFTVQIENLQAGTIYYLAAYVNIDEEYFYSETDTFGTQGWVIDIDGNTYRTVRIGNSYWMAENLKTVHYNDGTPIPNYTDHTLWKTDSTGAYCWYDNNPEYKNTTGALYNWHAINTGKLAPEGWHIPSMEEWGHLIAAVNNNAYSLMAEEGWYDSNMDQTTNGTNSYGFSAIPGGHRSSDPSFNNTLFQRVSTHAWWWSNDNQHEQTTNLGRSIYIYSQLPNINESSSYLTSGCSVRCVKDE